MLIKRSSKEFKELKSLMEDLSSDSDVKKKLVLYLVKAGHSLDSMTKLTSKMKNADVLFDFQNEAINYSFLDRSVQLHRSEEIPGLYYFKSKNDEAWDRNPFELKGDARKRMEEFWKGGRMKVVK